MLRSLLRDLSLFRSWLAVVLDTSHKLFPGRLAYKHELNTIEITTFDGNHLLIGEGEYGQVYAVKPTELSPELGNMIKLGTTRYGKSSAELCQIVDWDGSEFIFDIKREIEPQVAGYLASKGRVITIDLSQGLGDQYGVPGVIGSFFTVVRMAEMISFWPGLKLLRNCCKINDRI